MAKNSQPTGTVNTNPNLAIYNAVRAVPTEACKNFSNGSFNGTDINPMWRIKTLTEQFGPCGIGWYYKVIEHWTENINNDVIVQVRIELYVKDPSTQEWSKPIEGVGGNKSLQVFKNGPKVSDEAYKMALTDALSVSCKALGIGADIYWQADPTKYSQYYQQGNVPPAPPVQTAPPTPPVQHAPAVQQPAPMQTDQKALAMQELSAAQTTMQLHDMWAKWKGLFGTDAEVVKIVREHPCNPKNAKK